MSDRFSHLILWCYLHITILSLFAVEESSEFLPAVDSAPVLIDEELEKRSYEGLKTCLLPAPHTAHLTYTRRPWSLALRKEVKILALNLSCHIIPFQDHQSCCTTLNAISEYATIVYQLTHPDTNLLI